MEVQEKTTVHTGSSRMNAWVKNQVSQNYKNPTKIFAYKDDVFEEGESATVALVLNIWELWLRGDSMGSTKENRV